MYEGLCIHAALRIISGPYKIDVAALTALSINIKINK